MATRRTPTIKKVIQELTRKPLTSSTVELLLAVIRTAGTKARPRHVWSPRDEANVMTAYAFRHGFIEELHAGKYSPLLENPELSRITDREMKRLMIESSARLAHLLRLKAGNEEAYETLLVAWLKNCARWERDAEGLVDEIEVHRDASRDMQSAA